MRLLPILAAGLVACGSSNVDGSYDCANSACNGQFCCQYGGVYAE